MFNRIIKILIILSLPLILLNMVGGIIWLAVLGKWRLIGIGILFLFTSPWILSILMIPSLPIGVISAHFHEKKSFLGYVSGFFSLLYINILIVATCFFAFSVCSSFYTGDIGVGYIPYLLWSWVMAFGPWGFFTSKEPDNVFTAITFF
jgi:hypothetical protein